MEENHDTYPLVGHRFLTQGGTLEGVTPKPVERRMWDLVFALRAWIYMMPKGMTVEEWWTWIERMKFMIVSTACQRPMAIANHIVKGRCGRRSESGEEGESDPTDARACDSISPGLQKAPEDEASFRSQEGVICRRGAVELAGIPLR